MELASAVAMLLSATCLVLLMYMYFKLRDDYEILQQKQWWEHDLELPDGVIAFNSREVHIVYDPIRKAIVVFHSQSNKYLMDIIGEVSWKN